MTSAKTAQTSEAIHPLLGNRWSHRSFDANRQVGRDTLISIFEAARWAPSCFNQQPWRYLVCDRFADAESWNKALQALVPGNQRWAKRAPVLIVAAADMVTPLHTGEDNRWAEYDTGAASENLCLQASALGLAVHQMAGFEPALVCESFAIPDGFKPLAMIALGYPSNPDLLTDWQHDDEIGPRRRKALGKMFYAGLWDNPLVKDE